MGGHSRIPILVALAATGTRMVRVALFGTGGRNHRLSVGVTQLVLNHFSAHGANLVMSTVSGGTGGMFVSLLVLDDDRFLNRDLFGGLKLDGHGESQLSLTRTVILHREGESEDRNGITRVLRDR